MKTKHYELTQAEILALIEGLDSLWFTSGLKNRNMKSPVMQEMKKVTPALMGQLKHDYANLI